MAPRVAAVAARAAWPRSATNASIQADTSGTPGITFTYSVPVEGGAGDGAPSNEFAFRSPIVGRNGTINVPVDVPGAGTLDGRARATLRRKRSTRSGARRRRRTITYAKGSLAVAGPGFVILKIRPTARGRRALSRVARLRTRVAITFTPAGGTPNTKTASVRIRGTKKPRR